MKRTLFTLVFVAVIGIGGLFATGQSETTQSPWADGELPEEVSLQGTFTIEEGFPALETSEGVYSLGAPRAAWVASRLEEGTALEVRGHLITEPFGPMRGTFELSDDLEGHVRVTEATLDGETYQVAPEPGAGWGDYGRMGRWHGPHHGRGYGHMQGPGWNDPGYGRNQQDDGYRRRW